MRSGRGTRLPGMGAPAAAPAPPPAVPETIAATPANAPRERRSAGRLTDPSSNTRRARAADKRKPPPPPSTTDAGPPYIPHASDTKIQVNPRIYRGIWNHYEQLVDELPRDRRRGALTALINAVLAQHAPPDVAEARAAISWLRQAEARDTGS
jgi:hypothetical protein